jgi:hypothetical protein
MTVGDGAVASAFFVIIVTKKKFLRKNVIIRGTVIVIIVRLLYMEKFNHYRYTYKGEGNVKEEFGACATRKRS